MIQRLDPLRLYCWVLCAVVFAGEAATLLLTDKFWPQGMDEFFFAGCLLLISARPLTTQRLTLIFGVCCFLFGSLYTMFFSRIDPHGGSGERLAGLLILMAACALGACWSYRRQRQAAALQG
jgi:hypothetical protein